MYQRWPGLMLDNAVDVTSDKRTRVRWGVKLTHGRARQASGATNSRTRDARPSLRARMGSPQRMIAAWLPFVVFVYTGAHFWVCAICSVPFVIVVLFVVLTETQARRRRSHWRVIGAHPGPGVEPTRPRLRWTELRRTPGAKPTRPRPR
jgi:hypothetical protein